jgi:hypothetical protein
MGTESQAQHRHRDLDIDQDLDFQEKEWRIERIAWFALLVLLALALLGLFGTGWLSSSVASTDDDALVLDYERFIRHDGEASLDIEVGPDQVREGQVEFWISTDYLHDFQLQGVSPEPDEVRAEGDRQVYVFLSENPNAPLTISFSMTPERMGRYPGEIGLVDGPSLSFTQLSYP